MSARTHAPRSTLNHPGAVATNDQRTSPGDASTRAIRYAVISPAVAGCAWAALVFLAWRVESPGPNVDLSGALAMFGVVALGVVGSAVLAPPLALGLVARSPAVRAKAAWAGSALSALGGAFWLIGTTPSRDLEGFAELLSCAGGAVLFLPLLVTYAATRKLSAAAAPG